MRTALDHFHQDINDGTFWGHPVDQRTLESAAELVLYHPLKAYDAVQIASARRIWRQLPDVGFVFVSGDKQMLRAASQEGMQIDSPFLHGDEEDDIAKL
jgi:predicted nucleic acid-binding protein